MIFTVAEKFKSIQGEGVYAGTPMAFIRLVGCSVGKKICHYCDTDFNKPLLWRGGGEFTGEQLMYWVGDYDRVCLTGGEPLDHDIAELMSSSHMGRIFHIETSGTVLIDPSINMRSVWLCVSPKPGFLETMVDLADEVKVIVPGLGDVIPPSTADRALLERDLRWPTIVDALRWSKQRTVYLQPRNAKHDVDWNNLRLVQDIVAEHPELRLSVQMHKILKVQG